MPTRRLVPLLVALATPVAPAAQALPDPLVAPADLPAPGGAVGPGGTRPDGGRADEDAAAAREALARGLEALRTNRIAAARRAFSEAIDRYPAYPRALYELGRLDALNRRDKQAVELLGKAIAAAPDFLRAHHALGEVHRRAGRLEEAEHAFRTALGLAGDDLESLRGLAFVLLARSDEAGALYLFERAAARPVADDPVARDVAADTALRVNALRAAGHTPSLVAIAPVDRAALARPTAPASSATPPAAAAAPESGASDPRAAVEAELTGLVASSEAHFAKRRFAEALADLERARGLAPERASLAYRQGVVLAAMRDLVGARRSWEDALRLGGPRPLVRYHLSLATAQAEKRALVDPRRAWLAGRHAEALAAARTLDGPLADRIEADILGTLGMHAEALALWDKALAARPKDRVALAGRAEALVLLGRAEDADAARRAFYAGLPDEGWEPLFLARREALLREVEASLAAAPAAPAASTPTPAQPAGTQPAVPVDDVPTTLE